jgi:DEAD/DEAH box helicase domain-containing protein
VACAAYEKPLVPEDEEFWADLGDGVIEEAVRELVVADRLRVRGGRAFHAGRGAPASSVGLRTGSSAEYRIVDSEGRLIGTADESRAFSLVHPGALYLHQGQQYRVTSLDLDDRAAWVEPSRADEYTQPRTDIDIRILAEDDSTTVGRARLSLGSVEVTEQVVGFQRKHLFTGEVLGMEDLDLPPTRLQTRAFWYTVGDDVLSAAGLAAARVPGTVHAAEHAGIGILPLFTICDRWDVGGVSTPWQPQTGKATIVIYDGYPGGAGIAELGFAAGRRHVEATLEVISSCPCESGCPSCVQSPKCGNWNEPLDKRGAVALLRAILG